MKIANYENIVAELVDMLAEFDALHDDYQTDIYMYVDENNNATLYEFVNPGGNSWLDDDHIFLYADKPHYEDMMEGLEDMDTDERKAELKSLFSDDYLSTAYQILDDAGIE